MLGEALILETYCPDELQDYQDQIDDLKTDDTSSNDGRGRPRPAGRPASWWRRACRRWS